MLLQGIEIVDIVTSRTHVTLGHTLMYARSFMSLQLFLFNLLILFTILVMCILTSNRVTWLVLLHSLTIK